MSLGEGESLGAEVGRVEALTAARGGESVTQDGEVVVHEAQCGACNKTPSGGQGEDVPWYGAREDGSFQQDAHVRDVLVGLVDERYSTLQSRKGRLLIGFSKSGFGAYSLLLRNPSTFGYAAAWDAPWLLTYGEFGSDLFGSAAQMELYNPISLLPSRRRGVVDRARLVLAGHSVFEEDLAAMHDALALRQIPFVYQPQFRALHDWDSGWLPGAVGALFQLRDAP